MVDGIDIRKYLRDRKQQLYSKKNELTTHSAKRAFSSAISELMFVEEHLDDIDPVGKVRFSKIMKIQEEL